jgi:hypothetical protein
MARVQLEVFPDQREMFTQTPVKPSLKCIDGVKKQYQHYDTEIFNETVEWEM